MVGKTRRWMDDRFPKLGRRWFLGGTGAAIALPFLELSVDGLARAQAAGEKRLLLFHIPAGVNQSAWTPSGNGPSFTFGESQSAVESAGLRDKALLITGASTIGGPRGHTCGISGVLTGVQCRTDDATNAVSMDQLAAQAWEGSTRFPSIQLGTTLNTENPNGEAGYSTVIKANLTWANSSTPLAPETIPEKAFNRLFEGVTPTSAMTPVSEMPVSEALQVKDAIRASVLDYVRDETALLKQRLGAADVAKLDQFQEGLRQLESQIQAIGDNEEPGVVTEPSAGCDPGTAPAAGKPRDIQEHVKLMLDINAMAIACGVTRVSLFDYEHTTTEILHPFLDVNVGWHTSVTHHANGAAALANYKAVNAWTVSQFVYLANKLNSIQEGDNTVLDNSVMMFFSELGDGDSHSNSNIPLLMLGSAGGALISGQAMSAGGGMGAGPIEGVHLAVLQALGVDAKTLGRGTGPLTSLFS
jgi:Protein of unknown function (DUF1552)